MTPPTIRESDATAGNRDVAQFAGDIAFDQLWFSRSAANASHLEVSVIGTDDRFIVNNWFAGSQYHVEQFRTSDGHVLLDTQVNNLIQAMAAFSPPPPGQTTLAAPMREALTPVLAANWQ